MGVLRNPALGRALEITYCEVRKDAHMWIYDGEQWTEEGVNEKQPKSDQTPPEEMYQPELQVIEIVPVQKPTYVPPLPLP